MVAQNTLDTQHVTAIFPCEFLCLSLYSTGGP